MALTSYGYSRAERRRAAACTRRRLAPKNAVTNHSNCVLLGIVTEAVSAGGPDALQGSDSVRKFAL